MRPRIAAMEAGLATRDDILGSVDGSPEFCHGDLSFRNILVMQQDKRWCVTSILDWEWAGFYPMCVEVDAMDFLEADISQHAPLSDAEREVFWGRLEEKGVRTPRTTKGFEDMRKLGRVAECVCHWAYRDIEVGKETVSQRERMIDLRNELDSSKVEKTPAITNPLLASFLTHLSTMTSRIVDEPTRHAVVSDQPVTDFNFRDAYRNGRKAITSFFAANPLLTASASYFINGSPEAPRPGTFKSFPGRLISADRVAAFREAIAAAKGDGARTLGVEELRGGKWYVWTHTGPFEG
ncbi:hypothetical protein HK101_006886, partial [Irineochytrium annulatum]